MTETRNFCVEKPVSEVYAYLKTMHSYKDAFDGKLNVTNQEGTVSTINVPGMGETRIIVKERIVNKKVVLSSSGLGITITGLLEELGPNRTRVNLEGESTKFLVNTVLSPFFKKALDIIEDHVKNI